MRRHHPALRILRNLAGFALVILGVLGLFLPFLQGILFLVLGLGLIDLPVKHRLHARLRRCSRLYRAVALRHQRARRAIRRRMRRRARG